MILVICMAGFNTRFHDAGFDIPKYLLPWTERTVIYEILKQFSSNYKFSEIVLVANIRDAYFRTDLQYSADPFIARINYIGDTDGQAETAAFGALLARTKGPIVIHNADTILEGRDFAEIEKTLLSNDAYIDVFSANNPAYAYVKADVDTAEVILEKKEITGLASSGLYGFKSAKAYFDYYQQTLENKPDSEVYISDVLNTVIKSGGRVKINAIAESHKTTVLGSPKEYKGARDALEKA